MIETAERLATLEAESNHNKKLHETLNGNLQKIWETLDVIKDDMERRPPLWTTFLLTTLFSISSGLIVYLATH